MHDKPIKERLVELLCTQNLAVLTTLKDDKPHASLIAFVTTEDLTKIFFVTPKATRKFTYLTTNKNVALLIDNRLNQSSDFHSAMAVTAYGSCGEIMKDEYPAELKLYLEKHPHLEEFASSPSSAFICVSIERYSIVTNFQNVYEMVL